MATSFRLAVQEMVYWLAACYGFSQTEAFMLLGQIAQARCTQFVNPKYTYLCGVSKHYLPQAGTYQAWPSPCRAA